MKAILKNKFILLTNPTPSIKNTLHKSLSFVDKSKQYQLRRIKNSKYHIKNGLVKKLESEINQSIYKEIKNSWIIPSGCLNLIEDHDIPVDDQRCETGYKVPLPWNKKPFAPRDYQRETIDVLLSNWRGTANLATGLGKTLVATYVIKETRKSALIVVPSESIAIQFYKALSEAFGERKVAMYGGGKKKTADITVGIAASVVRNIDLFKELDLGLIIFDECFPYRTNIATINGPMEIGKLVKLWENKQELPLIKSFNNKTKRFEYKKMTYGWRKEREDLLEIKISKRTFRCTPEHKLLSNKGWKKACELERGDLLIGNCDRLKKEQHIAPVLNDDQTQILLGSFLGDGHINKLPTGRYRLIEQHGLKQELYCKWKASMFNVSTCVVKNNGYSKKDAYRFSSKIFDLEQDLPNIKTSCPQWVIDKLDIRGLAVWFMDDGYAFKDKNGANIAVCSFDSDSRKRLCKKLNSLGIHSKQRFAKCKDLRAPGYWMIDISKEGYRRLSTLIEPYIHADLEYKTINKTEKYEWNNNFCDYGTVPVTTIKRVKNKVQKGRTPFVFDIEVEDNHNFTVCSSQGVAGIVAHNCHHIAATTFFEISKGLGDVGRMYGMTATDFRGDGKDILIQAGTGPTIIKRDIKWGVENKWLAKPKFFIREVDTFGPSYRSDKLKNYKAHVLNNVDMKNVIYNDIKAQMENGKIVLCLVAEVAHGEELSKKLGIPFAKGEDKKSQSYVDDLNSGKLCGLIGTAGKISEGTDTKSVDVVILASFVAGKGAVIQSIGRGLRRYKGKDECTIFDYIPKGSDMLTRHAKMRIGYYKEITDDVTILESLTTILKL